MCDSWYLVLTKLNNKHACAEQLKTNFSRMTVETWCQVRADDRDLYNIFPLKAHLHAAEPFRFTFKLIKDWQQCWSSAL